MALRSGMPNDARRSITHAIESRPRRLAPAVEDDPLSPVRGIFYAAIGGLAVWAGLIGGIVAVIQRLR